MKTILALFTVLALTVAPAFADEKESIAKALDSAKSWLQLVDTGRSGESWDAAASGFREKIDKAVWSRALEATRTPLGSMKTRKVKTTMFTRTVPGAPDGEYVVIQFDTEFADKAAAVEMVTPMLDKDGSWRVSGYYIK